MQRILIALWRRLSNGKHSGWRLPAARFADLPPRFWFGP